MISPESCSSILWRSWDYKQQAAEALKLTSEDMLSNKLIDHIIKEPQGGAHYDRETVYENVRLAIKKDLNDLLKLNSQKELRRELRNSVTWESLTNKKSTAIAVLFYVVIFKKVQVEKLNLHVLNEDPY